jgi:hypothetical protein
MTKSYISQYMLERSSMNTLTHEKHCAVFPCLVDGCSIRATTRMAGAAKNTIQKLTRELEETLLQYHDAVVRNLHKSCPAGRTYQPSRFA